MPFFSLFKNKPVKQDETKASPAWYAEHLPNSYHQTFLQQPGKAVWTPRDYGRFADEGYTRNVVAYRCISMIAQAISTVNWVVKNKDGETVEHPAPRLLAHPNPICAGTSLL